MSDQKSQSSRSEREVNEKACETIRRPLNGRTRPFRAFHSLDDLAERGVKRRGYTQKNRATRSGRSTYHRSRIPTKVRAVRRCYFNSVIMPGTLHFWKRLLGAHLYSVSMNLGSRLVGSTRDIRRQARDRGNIDQMASRQRHLAGQLHGL